MFCACHAYHLTYRLEVDSEHKPQQYYCGVLMPNFVCGHVDLAMSTLKEFHQGIIMVLFVKVLRRQIVDGSSLYKRQTRVKYNKLKKRLEICHYATPLFFFLFLLFVGSELQFPMHFVCAIV